MRNKEITNVTYVIKHLALNLLLKNIGKVSMKKRYINVDCVTNDIQSYPICKDIRKRSTKNLDLDVKYVTKNIMQKWILQGILNQIMAMVNLKRPLNQITINLLKYNTTLTFKNAKKFREIKDKQTVN